jgi:hypothetical protein
MNAFVTTVMINNLAVDYEILETGKKFKAKLRQCHLANCLPCQMEFWKEKGVWKTHHPLTRSEIDSIGCVIDQHLSDELSVGEKKKKSLTWILFH